MSPYIHFEQKLQTLDDEDRIEFLLKTALTIREYLEEESKPKLKKCIAGNKWSGFVKTDDTTEMDKLAEQYFQLCEISHSEREKWNLVTSSKQAPVTYEFTVCCDSPEILLLTEYAVCATCGEKVTDSDQYSANFADAGNSPNKTISVGGNGNHTNLNDENDLSASILMASKSKPSLEYLQRIQGMKNAPISSKHWQIIYNAVTAGFSKDKYQQISHSHVDRILHQLKLTKYYPETPIIWEVISGNKIPPIPEGALWVLQNIMLPHYNIGTSARNSDGVLTEEVQKSTMKAFIYKCLELCKCTDHMQLIQSLKGEATSQRLSILWERHCKQGNWKYIA